MRRTNTGFPLLIPDNLKILGEKRSQSRDMSIKLCKKRFAGIAEFRKQVVVAVGQDLYLAGFPETLDQVEIRAICR